MLPLPQVIAVPLSISFVKVHVKYSLHYYYYYYYCSKRKNNLIALGNGTPLYKTKVEIQE